MQLSLADTVVEWTTYAIQTFATLPFDLQVVPFVSSEDAAAERLVIKVEIGEQYLEADGGFKATMTWSFKTVQRDAALANDVWAKVEAALVTGLTNPDANARAQATFSNLIILTENATTSLDTTANFRHYTRTLPILVKLA